MIIDSLLTIIVALTSSTLFFTLIQVMLKPQNALERMDVKHEIAKQDLRKVQKELKELASQCRDLAPDNSIQCKLTTAHTGLHTDSQRWWYGNVWFPTQLKETAHE